MRLRHGIAHLPSALQIDLQQHRHAEGEVRFHRAARGAVEVAGELGPLQQAAAVFRRSNSVRSTKW